MVNDPPSPNKYEYEKCQTNVNTRSVLDGYQIRPLVHVDDRCTGKATDPGLVDISNSTGYEETREVSKCQVEFLINGSVHSAL